MCYEPFCGTFLAFYQRDWLCILWLRFEPVIEYKTWMTAFQPWHCDVVFVLKLVTQVETTVEPY